MIQLTPEEDADLAAAEEEIARGQLATDGQMRAIWAKPPR
jgi:muconolactone delta-isomerase